MENYFKVGHVLSGYGEKKLLILLNVIYGMRQKGKIVVDDLRWTSEDDTTIIVCSTISADGAMRWWTAKGGCLCNLNLELGVATRSDVVACCVLMILFLLAR